MLHCRIRWVVELAGVLELGGWVRNKTVLEESLRLWKWDVVGVWARWSTTISLCLPTVVRRPWRAGDGIVIYIGGVSQLAVRP